jgi:hypothetical protein
MEQIKQQLIKTNPSKNINNNVTVFDKTVSKGCNLETCKLIVEY